MTPGEIDSRIIRARRALWSWRVEARLGVGDRADRAAAIATEIAVLSELRAAARASKRVKLEKLLGELRSLGG